MQYQLLPSLTADEYDALKADIATRGVQVPVEYDEDGNVLDGHHRVLACQELGIADWPRIVRIGLSEEEKTAHVLALNLDRRHLTREQRQELVGKLREQGWSTRKIAERIQVDDKTIRNDLRGAEYSAPDTVTGKDGKSYPARKPSIVVKNNSEARRVQAALDSMDVDRLPGKMLDAKRVQRLGREQASEERAKAVTGDVQTADIQLWLGDFRERGRAAVQR